MTVRAHPIERVLLIDDSAADNFLHTIILQKSGLVGAVTSVQRAQDAIEGLVDPSRDLPDLILLDLNMPTMNGFEFLAAFEGILDRTRGRPVVVMLSTTQDEKDRSRAESHELISHFLNKPLTTEMIEALVRAHF